MIPANDILRENQPNINIINHLNYAYTIFNQQTSGCYHFSPPDYISQTIEIYDLPAGINTPSDKYMINIEEHSIFYKQISVTEKTQEEPAFQVKVKMKNYFYRFKYQNAYYYTSPTEEGDSDFSGPFYSRTQVIDIDNRTPRLYAPLFSRFLRGSWVDFLRKQPYLNLYLEVENIPNPKKHDIFSWKGVFNEVVKLRRSPNPITGSFVILRPPEFYLRNFFLKFLNQKNLPYVVWSFFRGQALNIYPDSEVEFLFNYNHEIYSLYLKGNLMELFKKYQEEIDNDGSRSSLLG